MTLTQYNTRQFLDSALPVAHTIDRSTVYRGDTPIAKVVVDENGLFVNSFFFPFGEIPTRRIEGLRRWLSR